MPSIPTMAAAAAAAVTGHGGKEGAHGMGGDLGRSAMGGEPPGGGLAIVAPAGASEDYPQVCDLTGSPT